MSSELFMFENSLLSDPLSVFTIYDDHHHHHDQIFQTNFTPLDENTCFDQIESILLSSSLPSHQLENLSLCQTTTSMAALEVKTEECTVPFETNHGYISNSFVNHGFENAAVKLMQRSYSSNCFDNKPNFLFQPCFNSLLESPNFQSKVVVSSPESSFSSTQMRRVCSTGDLHKLKKTPTRNILSSSPLCREDAGKVKVGRYTVEERKQRIDRYRAKRTHRNFNKTIKYACRKTLADNRQRVRGRFARNDEAIEIPKTPIIFNEDLWVDELHEEDYHQYHRY